MERKIYSSWAFSDNEKAKGKINYQIYQEDLKPKSKQFHGEQNPTDEETKEFTCYKCTHHGYGHNKYRILSNPHNFSELELALICDGGNLCFGYRKEYGTIVIHTD